MFWRTFAVGTVALLLLVGCSDGGSTGENQGESAGVSTEESAAPIQTHSLTGQITLQRSDNMLWEVTGPCQGKGGYSDLRAGTQVVVKDNVGTVVGVSGLETGKVVKGRAGVACRFEFTVADIPTLDFYSVEVSHRGEIVYSYEDLEANGWAVELSLGD